MNGFKSKITFINLSNYDIYKFIATTIFGCWCFDFEFGFELMDLFIQSIFCACTKTSLAEHTH